MNPTGSDALYLVLGILILFLGRRLFWLFVAVIGAVAGTELALAWSANHSALVEIAAVLVGGIAAALLAMFLQPVAAMIAGFWAGGFIVQDLAVQWGLTSPSYAWLPFVVGGIAGALLMAFLFNWALIVLSSLYGATLIVQHLHVADTQARPLLAGLFVVGVLAQALFFRRPASVE